MIWTCEQTEEQLSDYLDGLLQPSERLAFDAHVKDCERCAPLLAEVAQLLSGLHAMPELEPPPRLVYSILNLTLGPRENLTGWRAALQWLRNLASPKFAYGSLSVAATLLVIVTASGFSWRKPRLADLRPASVLRNADREAHLVYARGTKFVSDLRVVYEIQSRLRQDNDIPTNQEDTLPQTAPGKEPGSSDGTKPTTPSQQNRATGVGRQLEMAAITMTMPMSGVLVTLR